MSVEELGRHGYNHMIVWLDENIASPEHYHEFKKAFATTTNPESKLQTPITELNINNLICDDETKRSTSFLNIPFPFVLFKDIQSCLAFLLKNAGKKRIFFMTSGALGEHIVPNILNNHRNIFQDINGQWIMPELDCIQMGNDDKLMLSRLPRDIANYLVSKGEEEFSYGNISSVELALQYFSWAKNLYEQADKVWRAYTPNNPSNPLNIVNQLIAKAEQNLRELPKTNNDSDNEEKMGVEN